MSKPDEKKARRQREPLIVNAPTALILVLDQVREERKRAKKPRTAEATDARGETLVRSG